MTTTRALTGLVLAVALGCGGGHDTDHDHDHAHGGHDHAAGEAESWSVTAWGDHFELFPEIDALVAGETAGSHVHVTVLDGFEPVTEGSVTVVLVDRDARQERFGSSAVVRPGIFNVEIRPAAAGERELVFEVEAGGRTEAIPGGVVRVGTPSDPGGLVRPPHALPEAVGGEDASFLKEQQWRTTFATAWADRGAVRPSVRGTARVEPAAGGEVVVTAPVDGVVRAGSWPHTGQAVGAGRPLLSLIPTAPPSRSLAGLEASVRELEALSEVAAARAERLERLLARGAVSRREVEQARAEATGLEARLDAARVELAAAESGRTGRGSAPGIDVSAPFAGRVAGTSVSPGEHVSAGQPLLRLVREEPVWVRVALQPDDATRLDGGVAGLNLHIGSEGGLLELAADDVRLVAVAPEVDPHTGTVEALLEVDRSVDELRPGLRAGGEVLLPGEVEGLVLPDTAVVDDAGVDVVYVQLGGESFSRRPVEVRHRQGDRVLVEGVLPGERVVTAGGTAIRRASLLASGSVEGHVH